MAASISVTMKMVDEISQKMEKIANSGEQAFKGFEEGGEKADKAFGKATSGAEQLGQALAAAGIVIALKKMTDAYFEFDEAADQFETALAKVSTIADENVLSMGEITSQIQSLSQETGVAVTDLSESVYSAISASVDTADAVSFVAQANALAVGGFTQTATAVDILTTALNAYGLEADQTSRISDVLIQTQNLGKTTVDELASSMGNLIPTAAAYGVEIEQLGAAYAGLTAAGINTRVATTSLNRLLLELSDSGSTVAGVLQEQTGKSFKELMDDGRSLGDVIGILGDSVDNDTVAFSNLWGTAQAGKAALSLMNSGAEQFNTTLEAMYNSAGSADAAFQKMTATGEFVEQKWENALNNLKIAIGDAQPQLDGLMTRGTEIVNKLTDFVNQNPKVVKAIEAAALAVGVFAAGLIAYTVGAKAAAVATAALTAAMDTNPILLAITAVAALAVGIAAWVDSTHEAVDQNEILMTSSQELSDKIDNQRLVVERMNTTYGAMSDEALEAKAALWELEQEFASSAETLAEFDARCQASIDSVRESRQAYKDSVTEISNNAMSAAVLVKELEKLSGATEKSVAQKELEKQVVAELNNLYPELGLQYDEAADKLNKSTEGLKNFYREQEKQAKLEADMQQYVKDEMKRVELVKELEEAQKALNDANEKYVALNDPSRTQEVLKEGENWNTVYEENCEIARVAAERSQELWNEIAELDREMMALDASAKAAAESMNQVDEAENTIINTSGALSEALEGVFGDTVREQAEAYAEAYQKVYESARETLDGTFGLFEKVEEQSTAEAEKMAKGMIEALESQAKAFADYQSNIEAAKRMGLDESLVEKLADGSKESMDQLDAIVTHVKGLKEGTDEAKGYIDDLNKAFESVEKGKDSLATTMTEANTELTEQCEQLKQTLEETMGDLAFEKEAGEAAKVSIDAYIKALEEGGRQAENSAQNIANAVSRALSTAQTAFNFLQTGHAEGTTYGENVYIAGEYGPELIVGREGSQVFPASETAKILNAVMSTAKTQQEEMPPASVTTIVHETHETSETTTNSNQTKKIQLEIKGNGTMDIGQSVSRKDLVAYMTNELEDVVIGLLRQAAEEEGMKAYGY